MARQITYSVGSEYTSGSNRGYYNPTFRWDVVNDALNFLGRYWDIYFTRVGSGGGVKIWQSNRAPSSPGIAAWQIGNIIRVSPQYNFVRSPYLTARVICHEFGHILRQGAGHAKSPGLMDPGASLPTGNLAPVDYYWFDVYARKAGAPRPHEQPNAMLTAFPRAMALGESDSIELQFGCNHSNRSWYDFRPSGWLVP